MTRCIVARTRCRLRIRAESLRLAYSGFYDRLRVSPEEPGLGQFDLLVRSIGLMALTAMAAVALAVFIVLLGAALPAATGASQLVNWMLDKAPRWGVVVMIVGGASWFGGMAFLPGWLRQYLFYAPPAALLLAAPLAYLVFPDLRGKHVERAKTMLSHLWLIGAVVVGALSVAVMWTLSDVNASAPDLAGCTHSLARQAVRRPSSRWTTAAGSGMKIPSSATACWPSRLSA